VPRCLGERSTSIQSTQQADLAARRRNELGSGTARHLGTESCDEALPSREAAYGVPLARL